MSKHTPGPWTAKCRHVSYSGGDWPEDEFLQWEVEGPRVPWGRGDFHQKDAQLMAAAPELLEALKGLLEVADFISENVPGAGWRMAQHKARAAINKAEGKA